MRAARESTPGRSPFAPVSARAAASRGPKRGGWFSNEGRAWSGPRGCSLGDNSKRWLDCHDPGPERPDQVAMGQSPDRSADDGGSAAIGDAQTGAEREKKPAPRRGGHRQLVEIGGFEPPTSAMRTQRSPN